MKAKTTQWANLTRKHRRRDSAPSWGHFPTQTMAGACLGSPRAPSQSLAQCHALSEQPPGYRTVSPEETTSRKTLKLLPPWPGSCPSDGPALPFCAPACHKVPPWGQSCGGPHPSPSSPGAHSDSHCGSKRQKTRTKRESGPQWAAASCLPKNRSA